MIKKAFKNSLRRHNLVIEVKIKRSPITRNLNSNYNLTNRFFINIDTGLYFTPIKYR